MSSDENDTDESVYRTTTREFAEAVGGSQRTIKRLVASGEIRSIAMTPKMRRLETLKTYQRRKLQESAR